MRLGGRVRILAVCGVALVALSIAVVVIGAATGVRCFVIETASMGTAAPVGTFVVTAPMDAAPHVGEVISFRAPGTAGLVVTHRVIAAGPAGIRTRGDLNTALDPWTLQRSDVVGTAAALVPGLGFALRCLPILLVAGVVVWLATLPIRRPDMRSGVRMVLGAVAVAATTSVVRPFLDVAILTAGRDEAGRLVARVVSTGLFPVRISPGFGAPLRLAQGQAGEVVLPAHYGGAFQLTTTVDLQPLQAAVVIAVCLSPTVVAWIMTVRRGSATERASA